MTITDARQQLLAANAAAAEALRQRFRRAGTLVVNLISSPGSGKTTLLAATAKALAGKLRMAGIVGDIATEHDADKLRAAGLPAHQIVTGGSCHLDARMVQKALGETAFGELDLLFLENVGNLVCPANYDLGEQFKIVLLSVTEGADKPFKYPGIFSKADVAVLTKWDLLPHVPFDAAAVRQQIATLRPGGVILQLSATTGEGLQGFFDLLQERVARCKATAR
ncbi:MAG: hydrogenase nickel incorporation protein HypB [Planctomycetes bacterium]|nr:hydrogenase nickel incorporation protein HypB [Planctomycetota bacterium]